MRFKTGLESSLENLGILVAQSRDFGIVKQSGIPGLRRIPRFSDLVTTFFYELSVRAYRSSVLLNDWSHGNFILLFLVYSIAGRRHISEAAVINETLKIKTKSHERIPESTGWAKKLHTAFFAITLPTVE